MSSSSLYVAFIGRFSSQSEVLVFECCLSKVTVSSTIRVTFIYFYCPWSPLSGCCLRGASLTMLRVRVIINLIIVI